MDNVLSFIQHHTTRKQLWVGYSGGLDSTVLLHQILNAFSGHSDYSVAAVHVHDGLQPQADQWVAACTDCCNQWSVPLKVLYVQVKPLPDQSPEEAAREARYKGFQDCLGDQAVLLLAHHAADQAETILWRLLRGTGPSGLGGMSPKTSRGSLEILRPFLKVSKETLIEYAAQQHLNWIEDPSNQSIRFDRNFLRASILPLLRTRWPKVEAAIARTGFLCAQTATIVDEKAETTLKTIQALSHQTGTLSVKALLQLESIDRAVVLRRWIHQQGYRAPSYDHMQRIDREILKARPGARPRLKIEQYEIRRVGDQLKVSLFSDFKK